MMTWHGRGEGVNSTDDMMTRGGGGVKNWPKSDDVINGWCHNRQHKEIEYKCNECQKEFSTHQNLFYHQKSHTNSFSCEYCDLKLPRKDYMRRHQMKCYLKPVKSADNNVDLESLCSVCNLEFESINELKLHMKKHKELPSCCTCLKTFKNNYNLKEHMKVHENLNELNKVHKGANHIF